MDQRKNTVRSFVVYCRACANSLCDQHVLFYDNSISFVRSGNFFKIEIRLFRSNVKSRHQLYQADLRHRLSLSVFEFCDLTCNLRIQLIPVATPHWGGARGNGCIRWL